MLGSVSSYYMDQLIPISGWDDDLERMDIGLLRRHGLVKIPKDLTERSK